MLDRLRSLVFGRARPKARAKYDAAQTDELNRRHWANADALAAVSSLTPGVRRTLRIRSRYEVQNNCYAAGLVSTLVSDTVGTGPRLQVLTDSDATNTLIETRWRQWAETINLPLKLSILDRARRVDGEGFAIVHTNERLRGKSPVLLDLKLIEADQVAEPWGQSSIRDDGDDGIRVSPEGEPVAYSVLRRHPGDIRTAAGSWESDWVPADSVIHWLRIDRPGQLRGVPELTPALPLFAVLRRFSLATLTAAETAANIAGFLETSQPVGEPSQLVPMDTVEFVRGMLLTLPEGWKMSQLEAKHPTTQFQSFVDAILREIGRCLDVPFGIMAGDSSRYNYSSARLDHQTYELRREVERQQFAMVVLTRLFRMWLAEAMLVGGQYIPLNLGPTNELTHSWHFDYRGSIDPRKDAMTDRDRLATLTTSLAEIYAAKGMDWQTAIKQIARERQELRRYGLTIADTAEMPPDEPEQVEVGYATATT